MEWMQQGDFARCHSLVEEGLETARKLNMQSQIAIFTRQLAHLARLQKDYPKARSYYTESLQLCLQANKKSEVAIDLLSIGKLCAGQGSPEKFARLLGMAEAIVPGIVNGLIYYSRVETERCIEAACLEMGDKAYTSAWEAGAHTGQEDAVKYALSCLQEQ